MDIINLLAFLVVSSLLVISPGPNGVLIAKTVPISGKKAGFANVSGFALAFYIHGTLSIFGISILLVQSAHVFFIFKILGAMYLCWLGIKSLIAAWRHKISKDLEAKQNNKMQAVTLPSAFLEGLITNVLNPKVSMFYLAAFPQFISPSDGPLHAYVLVTAHVIVNIVWFSAMVLLLAQLKSVANSDTFTRWLKAISGTVFLGFGAKLALLKPLNSA